MASSLHFIVSRWMIHLTESVMKENRKRSIICHFIRLFYARRFSITAETNLFKSFENSSSTCWIGCWHNQCWSGSFGSFFESCITTNNITEIFVCVVSVASDCRCVFVRRESTVSHFEGKQSFRNGTRNY